MKLHRNGNTTIKRQLRNILLGMALPFFLIVCVLLYMLFYFNQSYVVALTNANTVAELRSGFKEEIDSGMYKFIIGGSISEGLPLNELEVFQRVIIRLEDTTTLSENKWRIGSMLNLCQNLETCMYKISDIPKYDDRIDFLEKEIYGITTLIEDYMYNYIYDEVKELSVIQKRINDQVSSMILITSCMLLAIFILIFWYSWKFAQRITKPINELCEKVKRLGKGDFTIIPVKTKNEEIKTLDDGFNEMIIHITNLLNKIKEDEKVLHKTELELLQAQINPHFLYNTFDSIIWLAETHCYDDVVNMVSSLSTFFRNSLNKGQDIITLEDEEKQVCSYLEIQKIRYSDILEYEINIPKDLLGYSLPKLTLQPLVENALYHGIKNKRGMGKILISGSENETDIILSVKDNGIGISASHLRDLCAGIYEDKHTGLGLVNVHKRLKLYCGEEYGLVFESIEGEGTEVIIHIPKQIQLYS